jgi:hypothetical protein
VTLVPPGERAGDGDPAGTEPFSVVRDPAGGFLFAHPFYGRYRVSSKGHVVTCTPAPALPEWLWQRFLVGQPLPLASLLRGFEPLHAGAVAIDGRAVLLMGTSGSGKSSVALHLIATGAHLLADDVSALELRNGTVLAHPGPSLVSVDAAELARLPNEGWARLGTHEGEVRLVVRDGLRKALPVGAVYVLTRRTDVESLEIGEPRLGSPEILLGGTFNAYVNDPVRLVRQLDLSCRLAETVPLREVRVPPGAGAAEVAAAVGASCRESR